MSYPFWPRSLSILVLSLASLPALAQTADQSSLPIARKYAEVAGWLITAYKVDGQHMSCSAAPPGEHGKRAAFEVHSEGTTILVATASKGAEGDESKGSYAIDGKATSTPFYRRENNRNMGFLKEPHAKQLRTGKATAMTVTVGSEKTLVPLAGVDAALKKAEECNDREGR